MKISIKLILGINVFITVFHIVGMAGIVAQHGIFPMVFYLNGALIWLGTVYMGYRLILTYLGDEE